MSVCAGIKVMGSCLGFGVSPVAITNTDITACISPLASVVHTNEEKPGCHSAHDLPAHGIGW